MDHGAFGQLVRDLSRLPGLGPRSARRIALHLLTRTSSQQARGLASSIVTAVDKLRTCSVCGNLDEADPCHICTDPKRDASLLCVVASVADIWAMERTRQFKGRYHVLGGILSAIDGVTPDHLRLSGLVDRLRPGGVREVILALAATVDGQATTHYLHDYMTQQLSPDVRPSMTRLALGLPLGGELDFLDDGTITVALRARGVV
jgi:recombination protein RecR